MTSDTIKKLEERVEEAKKNLEDAQKDMEDADWDDTLATEFWKRGAWKIVIAMPHQDYIMLVNSGIKDIYDKLDSWKHYPFKDDVTFHWSCDGVGIIIPWGIAVEFIKENNINVVDTHGHEVSKIIAEYENYIQKEHILIERLKSLKSIMKKE